MVEACFVAAYQLIDRAHVHLERAAGGVEVSLRPRAGALGLDLAVVFSAELADQRVRLALMQQHLVVREEVVGRALFAADLEAAAEPYEFDPAEIAVPWEVRYGTPPEAAQPTAATRPDEAPPADEDVPGADEGGK
jgi:hypothetical protein